jgi:exonuclease VII small subunit
MARNRADQDVAELRRRLARAEERNLNAIDAIRGAEARLAQAEKDVDDIFHRLDVREKELAQLKEYLGFRLETPLDEVLDALARGDGGDDGGGPRSATVDATGA